MGVGKIFLLCIAYVVFAQRTHAAAFGVGFSLSLDYGVSSVYFANGSSIGIAKIEGNPEYKEMMKAQNWTYPCPDMAEPRPAVDSWQLPFDERTETLLPMLRALKVATESYLGSEIRDVDIVLPLCVSITFADALRAAMARLSMKVTYPARLVAGVWAALAKQMEGDCEDPARIILALDYSRAALTATLMEEECGVMEVLGALYDASVGTDDRTEESWSKVTSELRQLVGIRREGGIQQQRISEIVLLGESARDARLERVMRDVSLEENTPDASVLVGAHADQHNIIDPLFAPAAGVAHRSWMRLGWGEQGLDM